MTEQSIPQDPEANTISVKKTSASSRLRKAVALLDLVLDVFEKTPAGVDPRSKTVVNVLSAKLLVESVAKGLES